MTQILMKTIIGVLAFTLVVGIFTDYFVEGHGTYDEHITISPVKSFNITDKIEESKNLTREMSQSMFDTGSITGFTVIDSFIQGSFNSLRIIWRSFDLAKDIMNSVALELGLEEWVISVLTTMLLAGIGFSILFLLLNAR